MASDTGAVIEKWKILQEEAGLGTVKARETAFALHMQLWMFPPPADFTFSLRALIPALAKAGVASQAAPAGWTSLRVLALAARVLRERQLAEQYRRQQMEDKFKTAEQRRNSDYTLLISILKLVQEQLGIFNKAMM